MLWSGFIVGAEFRVYRSRSTRFYGRDLWLYRSEFRGFSGRSAGYYGRNMVGTKIPDRDGGSIADFGRRRGCEATAWELHDNQAAFWDGIG